MKDRILVLTNNIRSIYSFRKEVIICLKNEGFDIYISGTDSTDNEDVIRFFEGMGCHIIKTHFNNRGKNPAGDIILLYEYLILLKHVHPNVVLSFSIKPNIYGGIVCRLTRTPQIANITGLSDAVENIGIRCFL